MLFRSERVWDTLKCVYDPEIPVDIVNLGLIYDVTVIELENGKTGLQLSEQIYEKHRFFTERLIAAGVDPKIAEQDACSIEHAVSAESFQKLKKAFNEG